MAWFKVTDGLSAKMTTTRIPRAHRRAALGVWVLAGSWSAGELTDGHIPAHMLDELSGTPEDADWLVNAGIWLVVEDGWQFVDWEPDQPLRETVLRDRKAKAEKMANWRAHNTRSNSGNQVTGTATEGVTGNVTGSSVTTPVTPVPSQPVPTQPVPIASNEAKSAAKRGTRIPTDFTVTEEMRAWAKASVASVDIGRATEKFINYWMAKSGATAVKIDWPATWRNWMLTDQEYAQGRQPAEPQQGARRVISGRQRVNS